MPRLNGSVTTAVPAGTWRTVSSVDPSSITSTSYSGSDRRRRMTTFRTDARSLKAGTMMRRFALDGCKSVIQTCGRILLNGRAARAGFTSDAQVYTIIGGLVEAATTGARTCPERHETAT